MLILQVHQQQLPVIVVDEIGKMELISRQFEQKVRQLMASPNVTLLATIPARGSRPVPFADEIRQSSTVRLFQVF